MPTPRILARFGSWVAWYDEDTKLYFVGNQRTGAQFNFNSALHAIQKAEENARKDAGKTKKLD